MTMLATSIVSSPSWVVVLVALVASGATVFCARHAVRWAAGSGAVALVGSIAGPLMPALGAGFAVLAAVTVSAEATDVRAARVVVAAEATAGARLAWASTTPGVEGAAIRDALSGHLEVTLDEEWEGPSTGQDGSVAGRAALQRLEQVVRDEAADARLPAPVVTELLGAVDAVAGARRERLAAAADGLPGLYLATLAISGLALVANAAALTVSARRRLVGLVAGLAVTVSLTMALLVALAAPFEGPMAVRPGPIQTVVDDLRAGLFQP